MGDIVLKDIMVVSCPYTGEPRAKQAGDVALELGISREMQDEWAYRSQMYYQEAFKAGKFKDEIKPYTVHTKKGDIVITDDQQPRPRHDARGPREAQDRQPEPDRHRGQRAGTQHWSQRPRPHGRERSQAPRNQAARDDSLPRAGSGHPKYIATIPAFAAKKRSTRPE